MSPRPTSIDTQAAEGFSAKRGIQQQQHHQRQQHHHHQQEQQKTAVGWGEGTVMGLLRRSIMDRCPAQGLDLIQVSFDGTSTQKLTSEELEKKERRKEQNRRAARKCRQKKRMQQSFTADNHAKVLADNKRMEQEIQQLRDEKATLEKILDEHVRSGLCRQIKLKTPDLQQTTSPPTSSLSCTLLANYAEAQAEITVNSQMYLQGLGPMLPDQTFTDLDILLQMESHCSVEDLDVSHTTSCSESSSSPLPSVQPSSAWTLAEDPMDSLNSLMPAGPHTSPCIGQSLLCLVSPTTRHDRQSVSSIASDWSTLSEASQGFHDPCGLEVSGVTGPVRASQGSEGEAVVDVKCEPGWPRIVLYTGLKGEEIEEEEDEVFSGDFCVTMANKSVFECYLK